MKSKSKAVIEDSDEDADDLTPAVGSPSAAAPEENGTNGQEEADSSAGSGAEVEVESQQEEESSGS
jgi:hypothetical protein